MICAPTDFELRADPSPIGEGDAFGRFDRGPWQRLEETLAPLIGRGGVAAIYERSLALASADHPWLAPLQSGPDPFASLEAALLEQTVAEACRANGVLMRGFREVLDGLIGETLTDRLIGSSHPAPRPIPAHGQAHG
jgi:hypothetical protein